MISKPIRNKFILAFCFFCTIVLYAQESEKDVSTNTQYWLDYNPKYYVSKDNTISGLIAFRSISPHIYNKIIVAPTFNILNKKSPEFLKFKKPLIDTYHLGAGLYYTNNIESENNIELRLMQGVNFFIPFIKTSYINNYIRLEERFQKTFDGSEWTSGLRLRYQVSTAIEWDKHRLNFTKGLYFPISVEVFFSLKESDRFNDKIRISPGIGYRLNDEWKFEFNISYHNTKNIDSSDTTSNDIVFRLRVFKTSSKKVKKVKNKEEVLKDLME